MFDTFQGLVLLVSCCRISNLLTLKWRPFQYNTKFGKKAVLINVLMRLFLNHFMKKLPFLIPISKVHVRIWYTADFRDVKRSASKMTAVAI